MRQCGQLERVAAPARSVQCTWAGFGCLGTAPLRNSLSGSRFPVLKDERACLYGPGESKRDEALKA